MKKTSYSSVFLDDKYKLIVVDMDGTLYYQRSMQLLMCLEMGMYGIMHPFSLWKLKVVSVFRKVREQAEYSRINEMDKDGKADVPKHKSLLEWQYELTAKKTERSASQIQDVVEEWMFMRPLKYLPNLRDAKLCGWIKRWREEGKKVVVFSDYPAVEKVKVMNISVDSIYSSDEMTIGEMKPSPKGIAIISKDFNIMKNQILVVGDRMSKDGKMAERAGVDYVILKKWKLMRNIHY